MRLGVAAAVVDGALVRGDVELDGVFVTEVGLPGNGRGLAIPGLVDLQVNGYAGVDVLDAEPGELVRMGRALARDGVLWYQPTLITSPLEETLAALQSVGQAYELGGLGADPRRPPRRAVPVTRAIGRASRRAAAKA